MATDPSLPIVVLDSCIHSREWIAPGATAAFLHRLHFYSLLGEQVGEYLLLLYILLQVSDS